MCVCCLSASLSMLYKQVIMVIILVPTPSLAMLDNQPHLFSRHYMKILDRTRKTPAASGDELIIRANNAVAEALSKASAYYGCEFKVDSIRYDLKGRSAGQVRFPLSCKWNKALPVIRFNESLLKHNEQAFIDEVVPHECAHVVVYQLYLNRHGKVKNKPKPHGKEWRTVMMELYRLTPRVTHTFDMAASPQKRFSYHCACENREHLISLIRHNKVRRGRANYVCRACGEKLQPSSC